MHRIISAAVVGAALCLVVGLANDPKPAAAQAAVLCVNCDTNVQQLVDYAKQIQQYATQLQQYQTELQQYANMVQNTVAVPEQIYSTAMSDMDQVKNLMNMGSQLSFSNPGVALSTFSSFLNTATNLPGEVSSQAQYYANWSNRQKDAITAAMAALGAQADQLTSDDSTMQGLQAQNGAAMGQMQAIQNAAQIAAQGVRETEKLRQLLMVQIQLQANQQSVQLEQSAQAQAVWQNFVNQPLPSFATTNYAGRLIGATP